MGIKTFSLGSDVVVDGVRDTDDPVVLTQNGRRSPAISRIVAWLRLLYLQMLNQIGVCPFALERSFKPETVV